MKLALVIALSCATGVAHAESKADALFRKGKDQLAQKKYAEACATFEELDQLEPGIGAKLNVARCYEDWEKLALAFKWYGDAYKMATDTSDKRAAKIKELIDTLDIDVPRLTINLPSKIDPTAAAVKLDGKPFPIDQLGVEQLVDPGSHSIDYQSGKTPKNKTVKLERGASTEVELAFDAAAVIKVDKPTTPPTTSRRKLFGVISGGTGVVALGVAGVMTLTARSNYNDALETRCMGQTDLCDAKGLQFTKNAKTRANIATVVSIAGGAAIVAGVVLYLTAPKSSSEKRAYVAPSITEDSASVILGGRF